MANLNSSLTAPAPVPTLPSSRAPRIVFTKQGGELTLGHETNVSQRDNHVPYATLEPLMYNSIADAPENPLPDHASLISHGRKIGKRTDDLFVLFILTMYKYVKIKPVCIMRSRKDASGGYPSTVRQEAKGKHIWLDGVRCRQTGNHWLVRIMHELIETQKSTKSSNQRHKYLL